MTEEKKKVWKVLLGIPAADLEEMLNAQVEEGLQAYRIDRVEKWIGFDQKAIVYDVILFNPMLLGERASKSFTDQMLAQLAAVQPAAAPGT